MKQVCIVHAEGRQIFDSRGTPTVEATVYLDNGDSASAGVPSGASTGKYEAFELRDGIQEEYGGKGVQRAAAHITENISEVLRGLPADEQQEADRRMLELDNTPNKSRLGANAILAVSLACAKAGAKAHGLELYRYIGGVQGVTLPVPMMNILNGGAHAGNNVDIQEFMIMPVGARSFREAMRMGTEIYAQLGRLLKEKGLSTTVGDEGGYAPDLEGDEQALAFLVESIGRAGYQPGDEVCIAMDAATSDWFHEGRYVFPKKGTEMSAGQLADYFRDLARRYPIVSIEDPLSEEDFPGFSNITRDMGERVQIVGDDLFVTNPHRLQKGIEQDSANAVLVKPNQIGSLSETMQTVLLAKKHGYGTILSHRSGETEDTSIADIAVGLNAGQIKTGAPARSERVCKYNRLLFIEQQLGEAACYPGMNAVRPRPGRPDAQK